MADKTTSLLNSRRGAEMPASPKSVAPTNEVAWAFWRKQLQDCVARVKSGNFEGFEPLVPPTQQSEASASHDTWPAWEIAVKAQLARHDGGGLV